MEQKKESSDHKRQYIQETIVGRSKSYWLKRIVLLFILVIVFSASAGVMFVISGNWAREKMEEETKSSSPSETASIKETESKEPVPTSSRQEKDVESEQNIYNKIKKSMVTICVTEQGVDWFNAELKQIEETFGVIIDITSSNVLILANANQLNGAGSIHVVIENLDIPAAVKSICQQDNIALLAVKYEDIASVISKIEPIAVGDSDCIQLGDSVIFAGSPLGYVNSVLFGRITYMDQSMTVPDGSYTMYYTDINIPSNGLGVFINKNGELVGWANGSYKKSDLDDFSACIGIKDLNYVIEHMTRGDSIAMLGAEGTDLTDETANQTNLPSGFFLTGVLNNSPAYTAGLQNGDVIVAVDEEDVTDTKTLRSILNRYHAGDSADITVRRLAKDTYRQIRFKVIFAER